MPWKVAVSETVVVECTDTGARGGGAGPEWCCDEDEETRWRWVEVEVEGGGLRYVDDIVVCDSSVVSVFVRSE